VITRGSALSLAAVIALLLSHGTSAAADLLKLAIGQRGLWDSAIAEIGVGAGIFQKHNLELQTVYTSGGGETQQAVISGSVDIGVSPGMLGVLGAYSKGAPVRVIAGEATGTAEYYFVRTSSPVQKDFKGVTPGMTLAYSTNGSGTHITALRFMKDYGFQAKLIARQRACDVHIGDVGPGRHRLLHPAVRPRSRRAGPDQDRGARQ
jgi:NitT/TauT family transport system substrate-binding protein